MPPLGLVLSDDLIFTSRITGTGQAHGLSVRGCRSVADLVAEARTLQPTCLLLDLAFPGLQLSELLAALHSACTPMPRVVGYGSHVDAAGLKAARAAGCDLVLPRSAFVEQLPSALPGWLQPP